jgi:hypothetical protein
MAKENVYKAKFKALDLAMAILNKKNSRIIKT